MVDRINSHQWECDFVHYLGGVSFCETLGKVGVIYPYDYL